MADLNPLIRVRKHTVEQKQKALADLYRQAEDLLNQKLSIQKQMETERKALEAMNSPVDMLTAYAAFIEASKDKISDIEESMRKLEVRIEVAREDMREAFAEFKKIEITQERREAEELRELEKRQSELLDEVAIEGYRRRAAEE